MSKIETTIEPDTIPEELDTTPEQGSVSVFRKVVVGLAAGAVSLSAVGCDITQDEHKANGPVPSATHENARRSPTDELAGRIHADNDLTDKVDSGTDFAKSRELLRASKQPQGLADLLMKVVDLRDASHAAKTASYNAKGAEEELSDVSDPAILAEGHSAIDAAVAKHAIDLTASFNPAAAAAEIEGLSEPVRGVAERALDERLASEAANYASFDVEKARLTVLGIKDGSLRSKVVAIINLGDQMDKMLNYSAQFSSSKYDRLSAQLEDKKIELQVSSEAKYKLDDVVKDDVGLSIEANETTRAAQSLVTSEVKDHNKLTAEAYNQPELAGLLGNKTTIDLTKVEGSKRVETLIDDKGSDSLAHQFAEIYAQDGKLKFEFEPGSNVDDATKAQFGEIFTRLSPMLEAGFASGDILSVRYVISDSYDPYYSPDSHEVVMVLPGDTSMTVDQLASGEVHEVSHALTRSAYTMESVTTQEAESIRVSCIALKDASYEKLETHFKYLPAKLDALRAAVAPKLQPVIDRLIHAVQTNTIEDLTHELFDGEFKNDKYAALINECGPVAVGDLIRRAASEEQVTLSDDESKQLVELQAFKDFAKDWYEMGDFFSIYKKLNESNFVETHSWEKAYLGHSEDNVAELIASLSDAAISYPDKLGEVMHGMDPQERLSTIVALRMSLDLIVHRHPTLSGVISNYESRVLAAANAK